MKEKKVNKLPSGGIEYSGKEFNTIGLPRTSTRKGKAQMVLAKKGKELKIVHFGTESNSLLKNINKVKAGRKGYLSRSKQLKDKEGNLSKDNKFSPNYWSNNNS
jgi:hypothetical protein